MCRPLFSLVAGLIILSGSARGQFTGVNAGLTGVYQSSVAWGDYDNDGDLDILLTGNTGAVRVSQVYRNDPQADGSRVFTSIAAGLPQVSSGSVAWGDYDNDGDLDIILTGYTGSVRISQIYRNDLQADGSRVFTSIAAGLTGVESSSVTWGDYDNDGDLDILLAGYTGSARIARVYRNNGDGTFADIAAGLTGTNSGSASWGDYDGDGDLDILLTGIIGLTRIARVYRNGGGSFADITAGLPGVSNGSAAWGDYDSDGDLDIVLAGDTGSARICRIYGNNGDGTFTDVAAGLPGLWNASAAWDDFDNDNDLDVLLTGYTGLVRISQIYCNNEHGEGPRTFSDIAAGLPGVNYGNVAWGDYDNDGDLDILLTGDAGTTRIAQIYRNELAHNSLPLANAGGPYVVECAGATTSVKLDGSASYDPDGDNLIYQWRSDCPGVSFDDATSATPTLLMSGGHTGASEITLMVADSPAGEISVSTTTLTLIDTTRPVITLNGDATVTLESHVDTYTEPGAGVFDACDTDLTTATVGGDVVDVNKRGTYVVTYNAVDASDNSAQQVTRTVTVVDTTAPVITCPADITQDPAGPAGNQVTYAPVVNDLDDSTPSLVCSPPSGSTFQPGTTTKVTCTATDVSGNSSQCSFTVRVLSIEEMTNDLQAEINDLVAEVKLSVSHGHGLTSLLNAASSSLARGQDNAALGQLQALVAQVKGLVRSGRLSSTDGQLLIDAAIHIQVALGRKP